MFLLGILTALKASTSFKAIRYFIDSVFRDHAQPVAGSVLYCDLWVAVEHSGIYVGNKKISNIVVDHLLALDSSVLLSSPASFTSKSTLGKKIYVSCNKNGAVGHALVAQSADARVGERSFYGLVISNCHSFSTQCVHCSDESHDTGFINWLFSPLQNLSTLTEFEPTIRALKAAAREKLGATTWRLWDWDGSIAANPPAEPDWDALADELNQQPMTPEGIADVRNALQEMQDYAQEIADEAIPPHIRTHLRQYMQRLQDISAKYDEVKPFLDQCAGAGGNQGSNAGAGSGPGFTYQDFKNSREDFSALAKAMQANAQIKDLVRKMGRAYISEERKKQARIPTASRSEVHGTHRSDDVMRLLPSELLNLEDDTLENLFYARLLEKQLQTYELQGTEFAQGETSEAQRQRTGPVVACLDTSRSMKGEPLLKAKALLLAIAGILQKEERSLHVLLFGDSGQMREFAMAHNDSAGLLRFLAQGFDKGTDFETPLRRALQIIGEHPDYIKADVLMISDGDCELSPAFNEQLQRSKSELDCMVYSVLCNGQRVSDAFSDEVVVL